MARIKKDTISGIFGPVIFKYRMGKQLIVPRREPGTLRQTQATKIAGTTFGAASRLASDLKFSLEKQLNNLQDTGMFKRLNNVLYAVLQNAKEEDSGSFLLNAEALAPLEGLQFNISTPLQKYLKAQTQVSLKPGILKVSIGNLNIADTLIFKKNVWICDINISVALFRLQENLMLINPERKTVRIKKNLLDIEKASFEFDIPQGCMGIVSISLSYYSVKQNHAQLLNHKKFSPGMICKVFQSDGVYEGGDRREWVEMKGVSIKFLP
jgi:hypothetical protein